MKALLVMAHPDDEVIFGWPIMQNARFEKQLIMLVSDRDNPERRWCTKRMEPLAEICRAHDVGYTCLDFNSEFYRTPYRRADLVMNDIYAAANRAIDEAVKTFKPDLIFTHNPHGEYGMFDHRIVFDIVFRNVGVLNLCVTDICERHGGWPSHDRIPQAEYDLYYRNSPSVNAALLSHFYVSCKSLYESYGCWTWKDDVPPVYPVPSCGLYVLRSEPGFDLSGFGRVIAACGDHSPVAV